MAHRILAFIDKPVLAVCFLLVLISSCFFVGEKAHGQGVVGNPYCNIPTLLFPGHPLGAQATRNPFSGQPFILVDPNVQAQFGPNFMRFVLAHECAHHLLGHLSELDQIQMVGPYALLGVNPSIELEADCWAAETLAERGDFYAVNDAAIALQYSMGPFRAPGYPSGFERANMIADCGRL